MSFLPALRKLRYKPSLALILWSMAWLSAPTVRAESTAAAWLNKMAHAVKETDYQGILVFGNSMAWQTLSVGHMVVEGVEYEKIVHLTGEPREVVRIGHETSGSASKDHTARFHETTVGSIAGNVRNNISQIQQNYSLVLAGQSRVAGRMAQELLVVPRDHYRYGHKLWLDRETGLLLRSDLLGKQDKVLERYQFADIHIGKRLPFSEFDATGRGRRISPVLESASIKANNQWLPNWVPGGFQHTGVSHTDEKSSVMFTDGLSAFSLFVESASDEPMPDMNNRWGATSAVVLNRVSEGNLYRITLVGELPLETARRIAGSVKISPSLPAKGSQ